MEDHPDTNANIVDEIVAENSSLEEVEHYKSPRWGFVSKRAWFVKNFFVGILYRTAIRILSVADWLAGASNLYGFAERELAIVGSGTDAYQKVLNSQILEVVLLWGFHGHSGSTNAYAVSAVQRLLRYTPLLPLTGIGEEWNEVSNDLYQNNRCAHVFRERSASAFATDGFVCYDSEAVVFEEPDGFQYLNTNSRQNITFPYYVPTAPRVQKMKARDDDPNEGPA